MDPYTTALGHRGDSLRRPTAGVQSVTVDATGLQTFPEAFEQTIPLGTLSDWGWHTSPNLPAT